MEEQIIEQYEPLIYKIAHKFYNVELCDLYQAGCIGLIKAYRNFNEEAGSNFINFAYMYIYGEMSDYVNNSKIIKIQKNYLRLAKSIKNASVTLYNQLGHQPTCQELSQFLEIDENIINEVIELTLEPISIDGLYAQEQGSILDTYGKTYDLDNKILINDSLSNLNELEQKIIINRYYKDLTQNEIAKEMGLSQVKVSRLEQSGKNKIKEYILR